MRYLSRRQDRRWFRARFLRLRRRILRQQRAVLAGTVCVQRSTYTYPVARRPRSPFGYGTWIVGGTVEVEACVPSAWRRGD